MNNNCQNLFILSTIACKLSECLSAKELEALASDLVTLGYMIENTLAKNTLCEKN